MPNDEDKMEEPEEEISEIAIMDAIDVKYRDRQFADDIEFMRKVKINRETIIMIAEMAQKRHEYFFKKSKDNIHEANKYRENLKKMDSQLMVHSQDPFLQNWIHDRDWVLEHLTTANASSLQLMTMYSYLVPKLLDEIRRIYTLGARNYLNQETKERMDEKFIQLMAMAKELGYNLDEKVKQATLEHNKLKEKLRVLAMTKAEARRQTIGKTLFESILAKTDFKNKKYPTASESYKDVPYARADVIEAKDWLISTSRLKEIGKGRGTAKQLVLLTNQFVLVKSGSEEHDKYGFSRENTPLEVTDEASESKISQNEEGYEVEDAKNIESNGEPGD